MTPLRTLLLLVLTSLLAACGAGGVAGTNPPRPPRPTPNPVAVPGTPGILALAAGNAVIRIDYTLPGTGFEAALFSGSTRANVYSGSPRVAPLTNDHVILTGQQNGVFQFFGFAIRAVGASEWKAIGTIATARPALASAALPGATELRTYFVNPAGDPNTANGLTPATAFPSIVDALLVAFIHNGGNVWVCDGSYANGPFPIGPDVHVFGGFEPTFDIALRNRSQQTRLTGATASQMVDIQTGSQTAILDGIVCEGAGTYGEGIVVTDSNVELRNVATIGFLRRGMFIRLGTNTLPPYQSRRIVAIASSSTANDLDGFLVSNVVADVAIDRCVFADNLAQGLDCNDLWSMDNNISRLVITGTVFRNNNSNGLRADLSLAPTSTHAGGGFDLRIEGCTFEKNGEEGVFLDQQYDDFPEWITTLRLRDSVARDNLSHGIRINADQPGNFLFHRLSCTANKLDGLLLNSKSDPGEITVSSCWFAGNQGYGLNTGRSVPTIPGTKRVFASQCAFAGNTAGGFNCTQGEGSATNCIALRQPTPFTNLRQRSCFLASGPADNPFFIAPDTFALVTAATGGALTLQAATAFSVTGSLELADDSVPLAITSQAGASLVVTPAPTVFSLPEMLFGFQTSSVIEDHRLLPTSPLKGAGMAPAGQSIDPGPQGAPAAGQPGVYEPLTPPFARLLQTQPSVQVGLGPTAPLVLTFDRALVVGQNLSMFVKTLNGNGGSIAAGLSVAGATLTLNPPAGGWPASLVVELNAGLAATDGTVFGTPMVLPISVR